MHREPALRVPWRKAGKPQSGLVTIVLSLVIMLLGSMVTATAGSLTPLTDAQLDKVNAGSIAIASGVGKAQGSTQATTVAVTSTAIGPGDASASGQVTSIAASQSDGAATIAAARLSLSLSLTGR